MHLFSKHVFIVLHPYVTSQNVAILHLGVSLKFKFAFFRTDCVFSLGSQGVSVPNTSICGVSCILSCVYFYRHVWKWILGGFVSHALHCGACTVIDGRSAYGNAALLALRPIVRRETVNGRPAVHMLTLHDENVSGWSRGGSCRVSIRIHFNSVKVADGMMFFFS